MSQNHFFSIKIFRNSLFWFKRKGCSSLTENRRCCAQSQSWQLLSTEGLLLLSGLLPAFYKSQPCEKHAARFASADGEMSEVLFCYCNAEGLPQSWPPHSTAFLCCLPAGLCSSWLLSWLISCLLLWTYALAQGCKSVIRPQRREELLWLNLIWNDYLAIWTLNIQNIQMPAFDLIAITWPQESINYE